MKRQKNRCLKCYHYEPHAHLERLKKRPPKTYGDEFIFFPSSGDLAFASDEVIKTHIEYAKKWNDRIFLMQTKNPKWMLNYKFPENIILGITLETNSSFFFTPSKYRSYREISEAPPPRLRTKIFSSFYHVKKMVTIEPILDFDFYSFISMLEDIDYSCGKLIIYVGYDNHNCHLPEPKLEKTKMLIATLEDMGFYVRVKSLRKAWYE
ncbi:hypothetical protein J7L13_03670 [bacterium]|nr:hypothetical protein [bacterium]